MYVEYTHLVLCGYGYANVAVCDCVLPFTDQLATLPAEIGLLTSLHTLNLGYCTQLGSL